MWFGELITEYGIGNGVSLIIFAGIIGRGPQAIVRLRRQRGRHLAHFMPDRRLGADRRRHHRGDHRGPAGAAEVRPVGAASARVRTVKAAQGRRNFLPLRVNHAGVIPIIFAISIMYLPDDLRQPLPEQHRLDTWYTVATWITKQLQATGGQHPVGDPLQRSSTSCSVGFTYFYTAITFDPNDVADNLKTHSSFIPGIRPGRPTADYLGKVMNRVTFAGASSWW